jgi:deoxyribose-phosphate aldolase
MNLERYIDHTLLRPDATQNDIEQLCAEAQQYNFKAVCVPPFWVSHTAKILKGTTTDVATVIGFPFGYEVWQAKIAAQQMAIEQGAKELDVVHNISAVKSGHWSVLEKEIGEMMDVAQQSNTLLKVIIETAYLDAESLKTCCDIYASLNVHFVKTSTGFASQGAQIADIKTMRRFLPPHIKIKASGGIRDVQTALQMIDAGADRIGCSAGVKIVEAYINM